jgi:hypothetical protein
MSSKMKWLTRLSFVGWIPIAVVGILYGLNIIKMSEGTLTVVIIVLSLIIIVPVIITSLGPMLSFFGGSPATRRILRQGRSADATIKAIGESSMGGVTTVNDQPYLNLQLEVHDSYQAPYITSLDTIIPRAVLPKFQPGTVLPIKIDPNDPMKVAIDWNRGQENQTT